MSLNLNVLRLEKKKIGVGEKKWPDCKEELMDKEEK